MATVTSALIHRTAWRVLRSIGQVSGFGLLLALLLLTVAYPVLLLFISSFQTSLPWQPPEYGFDVWRRAFAVPGMIPSILNTLRLVVTYQILSLILAIPIAWLIARSDIPCRGVLETAFWISFFLPTLSTTLSWILLLDPQQGLLNRCLVGAGLADESPFNIYSFWGIVAAHLLGHSVSIKVMFLTPVFRNMDASLEEVARVSGSGSFYVFRRIFLPLMQPALWSVIILGVIHSLEAFEIEMVLGVPFRFYVYSTQIYTMLQWEPPDYGAATALSVAVLLFGFLLILVQRWHTEGTQFTTIGGRYRGRVVRLRRWRWPAFVCVASVAILLTVIPGVMLIGGTFMRLFGVFEVSRPWTLDNWHRVLGDPLFLRSLTNTVLIAIGSSLGVVALSPLVAYAVVRSRFVARGILDLVSWMPYAIPGLLLGLSFVWFLLSTPVVRFVYGTILALMLVNVVKCLPVATQILKSNFRQLGKDLEEVSRMAGGTWWLTYRRIVLPLSVRALVVVALLTFISGARDIGAMVLLVTSQTRPLSVLMLDYLMDGSLEAATVLATIVTVLSTGVALLARSLGFGLGIGER